MLLVTIFRILLTSTVAAPSSANQIARRLSVYQYPTRINIFYLSDILVYEWERERFISETAQEVGDDVMQLFIDDLTTAPGLLFSEFKGRRTA